MTVAGKLGGIATRQHFYEIIHRPSLYGQLKKENREVINRLEAEADVQLKKAFPLRYQEIQSAAALDDEDAQSDQPEKADHNSSGEKKLEMTFSDRIKGNTKEEVRM